MQNIFACENLRFTAALYIFERKPFRISAQGHHGFMYQNECRQASGPIDWTFVYLNKLPEATEDYPWPASSTAWWRENIWNSDKINEREGCRPSWQKQNQVIANTDQCLQFRQIHVHSD